MAVKSDKSAISIKVTEITSTKTRIKIIADVIRMKFIANRKGLNVVNSDQTILIYFISI